MWLSIKGTNCQAQSLLLEKQPHSLKPGLTQYLRLYIYFVLYYWHNDKCTCQWHRASKPPRLHLSWTDSLLCSSAQPSLQYVSDGQEFFHLLHCLCRQCRQDDKKQQAGLNCHNIIHSFPHLCYLDTVISVGVPVWQLHMEVEVPTDRPPPLWFQPHRF